MLLISIYVLRPEPKHDEAVMSRLTLRFLRVRVAKLWRPRERQQVVVELTGRPLRRLAGAMMFGRARCHNQQCRREKENHDASVSHSFPPVAFRSRQHMS